METYNIRLGFASNSSSTHSIIIMENNVVPDGYSCWDGSNFGWEHFAAVKKEDKMLYLGELIYSNIAKKVGDYVASLVVSDITGKKTKPQQHYIDHQSCFSFPTYHDGTIHREFLEHLSAFLRRSDVAILGGNDNETGPAVKGKELPLPYDGAGGSVVARYDQVHKYWTLFCKETGTKIRMSFEEPGFITNPKVASLPELVDIKVTDFCDIGCSFCYQGSTKKGKGSAYSVYMITDILTEMMVFEVAIGGGEPTTWTELPHLVDALQRKGIVPNITTKSLAWLLAPEKARQIMSSCGSIGFSVSSEKDMKNLTEALSLYPEELRKKITAHVVLGVSSEPVTKDILWLAEINKQPVLLLDFKRTGRGKAFPAKSYKWILPFLKEQTRTREFTISIDTPLAARLGTEKLEDIGICTSLFTTKEGSHSCYIDFVEEFVAPSSYCAEAERVPLPYPYKKGEPIDAIKKVMDRE